MLVIAVGFFTALDLLGLQKTVVSLLAGAGILGLAIGFAFQDLAENLLAGLILGIRKPCQYGDSSINFSVRYWIDYPIRTLDFNAKGGIQLAESLLTVMDHKAKHGKAERSET